MEEDMERVNVFHRVLRNRNPSSARKRAGMTRWMHDGPPALPHPAERHKPPSIP